MVGKMRVFYLILDDNMGRHQSMRADMLGARVGLVWGVVRHGHRLCRVISHWRVYRIIVRLRMRVFRMGRMVGVRGVRVGRKHLGRVWRLRHWLPGGKMN